MRCPYCEGEVSPSATKCRHCGEWLKSQGPPPPPPGHPPAPAPHYTTVNVQAQPSAAFAVVTLLFLIFLWPVGLLLNLVGIFTGPKRGCFVAMFLVLVVLPVALVVGAGIFFYPQLEQFLRELEMQMRQY